MTVSNPIMVDNLLPSSGTLFDGPNYFKPRKFQSSLTSMQGRKKIKFKMHFISNALHEIIFSDVSEFHFHMVKAYSEY